MLFSRSHPHVHRHLLLSAFSLCVGIHCVRNLPGPGVSEDERGVSRSGKVWPLGEGTKGQVGTWLVWGMVGSHTYTVVSLEPGSRGVAWNVVISVNPVMRVEIGRRLQEGLSRTEQRDTAGVTRSPGCQVTFSTRLIS